MVMVNGQGDKLWSSFLSVCINKMRWVVVHG